MAGHGCRVDWRDAASRTVCTGAHWRCRDEPRATATMDAAAERLSAALAPPDCLAVTAAILDRLREHHLLPPPAPGPAR